MGFKNIFSSGNQKSDGPATIMAIGLANPPDSIEMSAYVDFYFRVTGTNDPRMKEKYRNICKKAMIKKRYFHLDEELLSANKANSLNKEICVREVPKLGQQAAVKALAEWGRPKSEITHLIFCTTCGVDIPNADNKLAELIGLEPTVTLQMLCLQGGDAGGVVLRLAKDLAENNKGARVLAVCTDLAIIGSAGPDLEHWDQTISSLLFADGAAAIVVGSDPVAGTEKPIFQVVAAKQSVLPDSEGSLEVCLADAVKPLGVVPKDWNDFFYIQHPGSTQILDKIEDRLKLRGEKFRASRHILWEYGNMVSASIFFALDDMRKRSIAEGRKTTGEGLDLGLLQAFGPGVNVETIVLRGVPT